ncbi:hypothetical protein [Pseudonocardia adelaidensis]|uniref:MFS transporter n=1 Tax=Pseudonocardia adelaidensis TaxID=648754 RepID=A0ABP9NK56_9PSEU
MLDSPPDARRRSHAVVLAAGTLADGRVRGLLACTFVAFLGIFIPYTYFSAAYAPSTGGSGTRLAGLLLVFGLGARSATCPPGRSPTGSDRDG